MTAGSARFCSIILTTAEPEMAPAAPAVMAALPCSGSLIQNQRAGGAPKLFQRFQRVIDDICALGFSARDTQRGLANDV